MAVSMTPWMGTITIVAPNVPYQLSALLSGLADAVKPKFGTVPRAQFVALQANPDGAGTKFYIGNESLSATNYGVLIYATQVWPIYSMEGNLVRLDHIYVMANAETQIMNVCFITR